MKKLGLLALLLIVPFFASAAELEVETLEASVSGSKISYSGTMQDGSLATTCKLLNSDNVEIDKLSTQVDSKKFEGDFTVASNGEYTVECADFDGGNYKSVKVTVSEVAEAATSSNPGTGDIVMVYVGLLAFGILGAGIATFYLVKKSR